MDVFEQLRYFTRKENWGDTNKVNPMLLLLLDEVRHYVGYPFIIHNAYETSGHVENSQHYLGNAVDFHVQDMEFKTAANKILNSLTKTKFADMPMIQFCGIGIYPDWNNPGFHLDVRGYQASWGRIKNKYVSFDYAYKFI